MKTNKDTINPFIYTENNMKLLKSIPVLENGQIYIYVMLNSPDGNIKIGKTTNIYQRLTTLSGSNGAGNKIVALYCSPATWIHGIERTCHNHCDFARIPGTEWFDGNKLDFNKTVSYVNGLFYTDGYEICNELRKKNYDNKRD